jgi:hypothetical protein
MGGIEAECCTVMLPRHYGMSYKRQLTAGIPVLIPRARGASQVTVAMRRGTADVEVAAKKALLWYKIQGIICRLFSLLHMKSICCRSYRVTICPLRFYRYPFSTRVAGAHISL